MASTYSSLLGLELMATGENSGTWGTKTNNNLSPLLETAVCGRSAALFTSDANLTITIDDGVSSVGRYYILNCTSSGSLTATRDLICPLRAGKTYIVKNSTTGSQSIRVIGSSGTGITIPNGFTTAVYTDGTNYLQLIDWLTGVTLVTPALGTPASGVVTNLTGTASININGTVGATTPGTGAFTTLSTSGLLTAAAGVSSTLTTDATSTTTGSIITAGGISCQKSAVVGVQLGVGAAPSSEYVGADPLLQITGGTAQQGALSLASTRADAANAVVGSITIQNSTNTATYKTIAALYGRTQPSGTANRRGGYFSFLLQPDNTAGLTEYMQLTTTGLGIGTTPTAGYGALQAYTGAGGTQIGIGLAATVGLLNYFGNDFQISSNATLNSAGAWTARYTAAALMELRADGSIVFQSNTGLTAGNTFSPTERMCISSSGYLGIGTSSPTFSLHVSGSSASYAALASSASGSPVGFSYTSCQYNLINNAATGDIFRFLKSDGTVIGTNGIAGHLYFYIADSATGGNASTYIYTIFSEGNGTSNYAFTNVSSNVRGTNPVSSFSIATDGNNSDGVKVRMTAATAGISNARVTASFFGVLTT